MRKCRKQARRKKERMYANLTPIGNGYTIRLYWSDPACFREDVFERALLYLRNRHMTPVPRPVSIDCPEGTAPTTIYVKTSKHGWDLIRKWASLYGEGMSTSHEPEDQFERLERIRQNMLKGA